MCKVKLNPTEKIVWFKRLTLHAFFFFQAYTIPFKSMTFHLYRLRCLHEGFSTVAERSQRTANRKKHLQIKKTTSSIWQHTLQILTAQPRNALQIKFFIWLWAFVPPAVKLMKMFSWFAGAFLFACVFWSCSALSSLGHRTFQSNWAINSINNGLIDCM